MSDERSAEEPELGDVTLTDPAFWLDHPRLLREALADAAGRDVPAQYEIPAIPDLVRSLANVPGKAVALASLVISQSLSTQRHVLHEGPSRLTLTVEEAAELLGISRAFAYEAVHRGEIPSLKIGRRILVPKAALQRLVDGADGPVDQEI